MDTKAPALDPVNNLAAMEIAALIQHLVEGYHEIHRRELPELIELAQKVERVHHDAVHAPLGLADALKQLFMELDSHMMKEELVLFPAMREGLNDRIAQPIALMRNEHADHDKAVRSIEDTARGFLVPDGACRSWQRLYAGTAKLCSDLREHIRIENEILFPRFELAAEGRCVCANG